MSDAPSVIPRGIRNNNPGNIRRSETAWQGLAEQQTDPEFFQFKAPEYGIRAIFRILHSYEERGLNTIAGWIGAWAPPGDHNDTAAYIAAVCKCTFIGATDPVSVLNPVAATLIVEGMIWVENGQRPYSTRLLNTAHMLAFPEVGV